MTSLDSLGLQYGTDKASSAHDYLNVYEREISARVGGRDQGTLLELGWWDGASVRMWRDWLNPDWTVVGVDIEPKQPVPGVTFIQGDQTSPGTLLDVLDVAGGLDVVIDDASHLSPLTIESFRLFWPHVKPGGLYFVEDLQVSYLPEWHGWDPTLHSGNRRLGTSIMQFLKRLADDVHVGHADAGPANPGYHDVAQVAFWPGLCMVRKKG